MKLKLTLGRANGSLQDIVITTDASATVGEVAEAIRDLDPLADRESVGDGPLTLRTAGADGAATSLAPGTPIGEAPIASGAAVAITPAVAPAHDDSTVLAVLRIVGGPDAGREFALREGGVLLGRAQTTAVRLNDPLVSKFHARIEIGRTLDLIDLNSANGLVIDGQQFGRVSLHTGQTVLVGGTLLRAEVLERAEQSGAPRGPVQFNRSPRLEARYEGTEYKRPAPPTKINRQPFPWIALAAPLLMGGGLFLFTQNPRMLLFVAVAPLIMVGTWLASRASNKRKHRDEVEAFEDQLSFLGESLEAELDAEREIRLLEAPSTAEVLAQTAVLGPLLWTRRPEHWTFLHLRLGTGLVLSRNSIADRGDRTGLKEFVQRVDALEQHYERIDGVPVVEDLSSAGAIGITGTPDERARHMNALLVQLAGLYSPAEVEIAAVAGQRSAPQLEWLKWLPHSDAPNSPAGGALLADSAGSGVVVLSRLEELIERRAGGRSGPDRGPLQPEKSAMASGAKAGASDDRRLPDPPFVIVVVAADADVDRGRLIQLTERAADAGILPIWLADTVAELPAACRTFVELQPGTGTARIGFVRLGTGYEHVQVESVGIETATAFARHLAGVTDAGIVSADASDVPKSIALAALIGTDMLEGPSAVIDRWRENDSLHDRTPGGPLSRRRTPGKLRAIVGKAAHEAMALDLRTNGPHALVGGTTGSGKSEFLQAWVLGMAAEYSPDRVTFLFVDYKGGSAFAECVQLPHCVGLVTDLSPHLVRRALTSLRAELHHREHLFNRKKVKDLLELERSGDPDSPPALVLVIDEFAALAKEVPEFVDGVVDIAQRGRSLGIHLIMATQRPAGVIKDNLRANTNLRIALRMADPADSQDVLGDKVAAGFDPGIPGRAIAKTGPTRLTTFQSAYAGGWTSSTPAPPEIGLGELRFGAVRRWERPPTAVSPDVDRGPNDQSRLVASIVGAATGLALPAPRRPWLDELATVFDATKLRQRSDEELLLGVQDLPHLQRQDLAVFRPDAEGHLAIYGASGSGKTVTLRTLGTVAGITPRSGAVDVYGLDYAGNGLRMLEALPHVGSVINGDDTERVIRLLRQLKDELDRRSELFAVVNAATIVEYRALSGQRDLPRILVLLDGYPAFRTAFEHVAASAVWYQRFMELLNEGRQLGIHVAITADRPGSVSTAVNSAIQRRVILRMSDEQAYLQIDAPRDILDASSAPGRAIIDGYESQIAIIGGSASALEQSKAIDSLAAAMRRNGRVDAAPVRALPREYAPAELPGSIAGRPVLGIGEDTLEPYPFEATGVMLLGGPPASGRSNALAWIARSVATAHPVTTAYFGNPRSSLVGSRGWDRVATTIEAAVEHARALSAELSAQAASGDDSVKHLIVIEGISDFLTTPADAPLTELIKAVKRSSSFLVGEGDTTAWSSSWPLMAEIKAARTGLLLQPESMEGDMILRTAFPRGQRSDFPVGRGFHVARGRVARVQLPLLEE